MTLLFISIRNVNSKNSGGEKCTNRNYLSFCRILGDENVSVFNISVENEPKSLKKFLLRQLGFFQGFYAGLTSETKNTLLMKASNFDMVFIDVSYLGILAYHLYKSGYKGKIVSFFHNVELSIMRQKTRVNPIHSWKKLIIRINERNAVKYSDYLIALTNHDKEQLMHIYNATNVNVIPISLKDEYVAVHNGPIHIPPTFLFIGDNWFPNLHGLKWFIKNVLDHVDIKLVIVGRNLNMFQKEFSHPKIEFLGFVKDLHAIISEADFFLCPVFRGGGMKVKICEALMYGKNIVGTDEAFKGYELDIQAIGAVCNSKEEFIRQIKKISNEKKEKYNLASREAYLAKYSLDATLPLFQSIFDH